MTTLKFSVFDIAEPNSILLYTQQIKFLSIGKKCLFSMPDKLVNQQKNTYEIKAAYFLYSKSVSKKMRKYKIV